MKKERSYILKLIRPLIASLEVFLVLILLFAHNFGIGSTFKPIETQEQWKIELTYPDGTIRDSDGPWFPQLRKGGVMHAEMIPEGNSYPQHAALSFVLYHSVVDVSVDGKTIYQQEKPDADEQIGGMAYLISLPHDYVGKKIEVTARVAENDGISSFSQVRFSKDTEALYALAQGKTFQFLVFGAMLIVSVFMTLFYSADGLVHHESLYNGLLAMSCALIILWYLGYCSLLYFFSDRWSFAANCEYPALFAAPVPLAFHMAHVIKTEPWKKTERVLAWISAGFFTVSTLVTVLPTPYNYTDFTVYQHIISAAVLLVSAIGLSKDDRKESSAYTQILSRGLIISIAAAVMELIRFNLNLHFGNRFSFLHFELAPFALLSLLITLLLSSGVRASEESIRLIQQESLKKLAYMDPLTSLSNRADLHRIFDEMRQNNRMDYVILFADINYLKKTNDTYGHEAGDQLIVETASILKECIGTKGFAGRWGGDELVGGIYGSEKDALDCLAQMHQRAEEINHSGRYPFTLSVSCGYCVSTSASPVDPDEALRIADEKMYERKVSEHRQRE